MSLRGYQNAMVQENFQAWNQGAKVLCDVLPTGGGKTHVFSHVMSSDAFPQCAIAHRQELVGQISLALARCGVEHFIIGPKEVRQMAIRAHIRNFGKDFYRTNARVAVAGVDTLIRRKDTLGGWCKTVKRWVLDEGHHLLRSNKWGKAVEMFPNAQGLTVTATPFRPDGYGLGRHADGVIDKLILGPSTAELMDLGFLTRYVVKGVFTNIDLSPVNITASGDYNDKKLKIQVRKSTIVGDVVEHYINHAYGKLDVVFATDVETAIDFSAGFNSRGIPAEVITAKTPTRVRENIFQRFEKREVLVIVNVDILGEGFDCPAIEVIQFARPTQSYNLYLQQFGRVLRPMPGNPGKIALVLDHVGNVIEHLLPDRPKFQWSLDRREKKSSTEKGVPVRVCPACTLVYERFHKSCPFCGFTPIPLDRSKPEFVDGDLTEMSPEIIEALYAKIHQINQPESVVKAGLSGIAALGAAKQHRLRREAQVALRETMALWAGYQRSFGKPDSESYRRFFHRFGTDVLTAQTLGRPDAERLNTQIKEEIAQWIGR